MRRFPRFKTFLILLLIALAAFPAIRPTAPQIAHAQEGNLVTVISGAANIRSGPSAATTILGSVPNGTVLLCTGRSGTGWWRVESPYGTGWISARISQFRGDYAGLPVTSDPAGAEAASTVVAAYGPVKVFSNPNFDSFVIAIVPSGDSLTIIAITGDGNWVQVSSPSGVGYVNLGAVARRGPLEQLTVVGDPGPSFNGPTVQLNTDTVVIGVDGNAIGVLPAGAIVPVVGRNADGTRWMVAPDFGVGFISVTNVTLAGTALEIPVVDTGTIAGPPADNVTRFTATVIVERKLLYKKDNYSGVVLDARRGAELNVIARNPDGTWLQVIYQSNVVWVNFSGISLNGSLELLPVVSTETPPNNRIIINTYALNVRSGPGPDFTSIAVLSGGTEVRTTGRSPDYGWWRIEGDFGVGWVNMKYVIFRGQHWTVPFVTEPAGEIALPYAIVAIDRPVYTTWEGIEVAGTLPGGTQYTVLARSDDNWTMLQLDTPLGHVWLNAGAVVFRGNPDLVPVRHE